MANTLYRNYAYELDEQELPMYFKMGLLCRCGGISRKSIMVGSRFPNVCRACHEFELMPNLQFIEIFNKVKNPSKIRIRY